MHRSVAQKASSCSALDQNRPYHWERSACRSMPMRTLTLTAHLGSPDESRVLLLPVNLLVLLWVMEMHRGRGVVPRFWCLANVAIRPLCCLASQVLLLQSSVSARIGRCLCLSALTYPDTKSRPFHHPPSPRLNWNPSLAQMNVKATIGHSACRSRLTWAQRARRSPSKKVKGALASVRCPKPPIHACPSASYRPQVHLRRPQHRCCVPVRWTRMTRY